MILAHAQKCCREIKETAFSALLERPGKKGLFLCAKLTDKGIPSPLPHSEKKKLK